MRTAYVVIGANYGDEGKGLMTDYLVRANKVTCVTRFNGGSQAGHTVVDPAIGRNVFNMYSSGTFAGAATRISRQALIAPHAILGEGFKLQRDFDLKLRQLVIDDRARVTLPFDIWLNQQAERARGANRHGSCGLGVNETVTRSQRFDQIIFGQLVHWEDKRLEDLVWKAYNQWVPIRTRELGVPIPLTKQEAESMLDLFVGHVRAVREVVENGTDYDNPAFRHFFKDPIVYEGAQGLGLDEDFGHFPHVTRSRTGLINAAHDLQTWSARYSGLDKEVEVVYTTRAYLTRHGAGPLSHEMPSSDVLCGGTVVDETNQPNPWQGTIRFAPLHLPDLNRRIYADLGRVAALPYPLKPMKLKPVVALTCLDQADHFMVIKRDGEAPVKMAVEDLRMTVERGVGLPVRYCSRGPTAEHVEVV